MSERKRKPLWARFIIGLLSTIMSIAVLLGGACVFVKVKYDISVFDTISQIKILNEEINESEMYQSKFSESDMASAMTAVNAKITGLITYDETTGYSISSDGLSSDSNITSNLLLTGKQVGAILNNILQSQATGAKINVGGRDIELNLVQIAFDNIDNANKKADLNVVVKLDISFLKDMMKDFPLSLIKDKIPNTLYISSTTTIVKGETSFSYTIESKELTINKLDKEQTASFLKTLNLVMKFGTSDELNLMIGTPFVNALIGNAENNGFAYSLRDLGATDYDFEIVSDVNYYVIKH